MKSTDRSETPEKKRLLENEKSGIPWKKWGPYLSERQWGTVREDYSENGDPWNHFPHDQSRSRAYRWGEDGIAGISDDRQQLCFSLAMWNGKDPILKERLFGLNNHEGNHGEDVKEYYYYLDSTPTHSYMKYLYKYPQEAFPYNDLVQRNNKRSRKEEEYELIDTGIFKHNKYFDVIIEYAKESPEDLLIRITVFNRSALPAEIILLPTLFFRNTWSWDNSKVKPEIKDISDPENPFSVIHATKEGIGDYYLYFDGKTDLLFTENETNNERIFGTPNQSSYVKDGINNYVIHKKINAINQERKGTKASVYIKMSVAPEKSTKCYLRLNNLSTEAFSKTYGKGKSLFGKHFRETFSRRISEADEFYQQLIPASLSKDEKNVMRQALAGMLWNKQFYFYDVTRWLDEHGTGPFKKSSRISSRNEHWHHMYNGDIISMPDKWEYPWYASWDLAFHVLALTLTDPEFGKEQLKLILQGQYMHPNGQIPAYEWNFSDVNPPVLAFSTIFSYRLDKLQRNVEDENWLKCNFHRLLMNFTWWVNRKDRTGRNIFEGGFLGLDNIGVFDRSAPLPTGGYLEQADGTAWMALFCQNMLEIAVELSLKDPVYKDMAEKFTQHFLWIASSMMEVGYDGMWDEDDGFFYDVLKLPLGQAERLKVRSMVGLLPFCAVTIFENELMNKYPEFREKLTTFLESHKELFSFIHDPVKPGKQGRKLASILDESRLRRVLHIMLDENEFLSPYGIRSLSKYHEKHPYSLIVNNTEFSVSYLPGESDKAMFGGNSNWRGPVWIPLNALIIRALLQYYAYYGDDLQVEFPTGSGNLMNLYDIAENISQRLTSIFTLNEEGYRPVFGGNETFNNDPEWKDHILFYEYFHGDNGSGLGASHQTGWTGVIARLMHLFSTSSAEQVLKLGKKASYVEEKRKKAAKK